MKIDGTLDIEAAAWDRFAVAATYAPQDGKRILRSISDLVDHLLARPRLTWWAHCGGNYDFLAIAEEMRRRKIPCSIDLAGSRVSRLVGGGIVLRDSYPLIPMALDKAARIADEHAPTLGLPCTCGKAETPISDGCGGYCAIRPNDPRARVADYCAEDARVLFAVLTRIRAIAHDAGLQLRGTLGGTAWASAQAELGLPDADMPIGQWKRIRDAYFGGRVTIVRPRAAGPGAHWDMRSAYPAALSRTAVPLGEPGGAAGKDAGRCYSSGRPGVYACAVTVPDMLLPPLPARVGHRVTYPVGKLRGVWTLPELEAAQERGVTIDAWEWALVWPGTDVLFADLMRGWFARRTSAGKGTPLGEWWRLLCNTLTGKFAQGPERRSAKMFPTSIRTCPATRPCSRLRCSGRCGAMEQLDFWGQVWGVPFFRPATSGHVQWAAYLTAACRIAWLTGAETQGESLVYGNTDSIWTTGRIGPRPQGATLGAWEYKHGWSQWECAAPGAYRFRDEDGGAVTCTSGMAVTDEEFAAGAAENDRGVLSFLEAAKASRGLFRRKHASWTLPSRGRDSGRYGDRLLDPIRGITLPIPYGH